MASRTQPLPAPRGDVRATGGPIATTLERPVLVAVVLALAPIAVVALLRLPLVNQLDFADAWFYSGYAWTPKHHFEDFGFTYFAVRFSAILPIGAFETVFGVEPGYLLLRYLLAVATGLALFVLVRRFASMWIALASVLLLYLNPFFSRLLLWDYTLFAVVSFGLIGVCLWWLGEGRHWVWTAAAGAALGCAFFAHAGFGTALAPLGLIELIAAVRGGRSGVRTLAHRTAFAFGGTLAAFTVGWLAYCALLGFFGPYDMLRPVVDLFSDNEGVMGPYVQPVDRWLLHSPRLLPPIVLSVALIFTMRRDFLGTALVARIAQFCLAYTVFIWVMRFSITSAFIEAWFYYHLTVVAMAPGLAVLLHELAARRALWVVPATLVLTLVGAMLIRWLPWGIDDLYATLLEHEAALIALALITTAAAALLSARGRVLMAGAVVLFVLGSTVMLYSTDPLDGRGGTGMFVQDGDQDWVGYRAGHELAELIRAHERAGAGVLLWYPTRLGYESTAWVDLPQHAQTVQELGAPNEMDELTPLGISRLNTPGYVSLLVFSTDPDEVGEATAAARAQGYDFDNVERGRLADGHLAYAMMRIAARP